MALFGKKKTVACAICGAEAKTGFFRGLFQREIEGQYVCSDCYGVVHLPGNMANNMTLEQFKGYMAFREENGKLKEKFQITGEVDFGVLDSKFVFDMNNRLMCTDKNLNATIFEAKHIKSFTIKEDGFVIFQGDAHSLTRNESNVPNQIMSLSPRIQMYQMEMRRYEQRLNSAPEEKKDEIRREKPIFNIVVPFSKYVAEIHLDHPYWEIITADIDAPTFDRDHPDINDYLNKYHRRYGIMEDLANTLTALAFPGAMSGGSAPAAVPTSADTVSELKRYKELLDMGIITEAEFAGKKRQLLGL